MTPYEHPVASDPRCGACAYRVNAELIAGATVSVWMDCTHPAVGRKKCEQVRLEGACGPTATLFEPHPDAPEVPAQGVLL